MNILQKGMLNGWEIYRFLGFSVSYIQETTDAKSKMRAYRADKLYLTAKQAGFDFLHDSVQFNPEACVQRPYIQYVHCR